MTFRRRACTWQAIRLRKTVYHDGGNEMPIANHKNGALDDMLSSRSKLSILRLFHLVAKRKNLVLTGRYIADQCYLAPRACQLALDDLAAQGILAKTEFGRAYSWVRGEHGLWGALDKLFQAEYAGKFTTFEVDLIRAERLPVKTEKKEKAKPTKKVTKSKAKAKTKKVVKKPVAKEPTVEKQVVEAARKRAEAEAKSSKKPAAKKAVEKKSKVKKTVKKAAAKKVVEKKSKVKKSDTKKSAKKVPAKKPSKAPTKKSVKKVEQTPAESPATNTVQEVSEDTKFRKTYE